MMKRHVQCEAKTMERMKWEEYKERTKGNNGGNADVYKRHPRKKPRGWGGGSPWGSAMVLPGRAHDLHSAEPSLGEALRLNFGVPLALEFSLWQPIVLKQECECSSDSTLLAKWVFSDSWGVQQAFFAIVPCTVFPH